MYSFESRVRYSEVGVDNRLTLDAVINYFQDCSSFQSEELGVGIEFLKETCRCWVLSSWEIIIHRYPVHREKIKVSTWPSGMNGFFGTRNYQIEDECGTMVAKANSIWVYMDTRSMRPVRVDRNMLNAYEISPELPGNWHSRKMKVKAEGQKREAFPVCRYHLDTNEHVNNGKYILMAQEYLPLGFEVRSLRAEYKKAALLGDVIYPKVNAENDEVTVTLAQENGTVFATVGFQG